MRNAYDESCHWFENSFFFRIYCGIIFFEFMQLWGGHNVSCIHVIFTFVCYQIVTVYDLLLLTTIICFALLIMAAIIAIFDNQEKSVVNPHPVIGISDDDGEFSWTFEEISETNMPMASTNTIIPTDTNGFLAGTDANTSLSSNDRILPTEKNTFLARSDTIIFRACTKAHKMCYFIGYSKIASTNGSQNKALLYYIFSRPFWNELKRN